MNSDQIKRDILMTINGIANPATLTSQVVTGIMRSNYTTETIRSLILDPVISKAIPHIALDGYKDCNNAMWVFFFNNPKEFIKKILKNQDEEVINRLKEEWEKGHGFYEIYDYLPPFDKPEIVLMHYKGCIVYVNWVNPEKDGYINMTLHFLGMSSGKIALEFVDAMEQLRKDMKDIQQNKFTNRVSLRTFDGGPRPRYSFCRVPSTIIVDHVQKEMDAIISMVEKSEDVQKNYEIDSTIGVLLYGPAGTGKSTLARWLALKLKRTLILTTADSLRDAVMYVKDSSDRDSEMKYILLIEDIDFMFADRRTSKKDQASRENLEITNYFFQVLDGVLASSNLLVIATTNYIDRLDPALIRDGRFDFKVEVNGLDYSTAAKVCNRFDVKPEEINLETWQTPISPATLQAILLKYKVGAEVETMNVQSVAIDPPPSTGEYTTEEIEEGEEGEDEAQVEITEV